ncbi:hypothetical protein RJ641_016558 [Dillenia turbinata]|uniref:Uncharacterized protein n=1 Tax=Dillenia turbinata TaxID=194707 RepID=A0AAN8YYT3_9MAGN
MERSDGDYLQGSVSWKVCVEVLGGADCALAPVEDQRELVEKSKSIALREAFLQWSEWQLCDSIPPTGGFAYSFGLEAAVRTCIISDPEDLRICIVHVLNNTGSLLLPLVYSKIYLSVAQHMAWELKIQESHK